MDIPPNLLHFKKINNIAGSKKNTIVTCKKRVGFKKWMFLGPSKEPVETRCNAILDNDVANGCKWRFQARP